MAQKALYEVTLPNQKADKLVFRQSEDVNQTRLNENFTRIDEMLAELYNSKSEVPSVSVPTKLSQLENDKGFITQEAVPTKVSELENDAGYITEAGGAEITLLWSNPSTTTAFAAQTTSISELKDYDYVAITMMPAYNSDAQFESYLQLVPVDGAIHYVYAIHASGAYYFTRGATVSKSDIVWTQGMRKNLTA